MFSWVFKLLLSFHTICALVPSAETFCETGIRFQCVRKHERKRRPLPHEKAGRRLAVAFSRPAAEQRDAKSIVRFASESPPQHRHVTA